jgi:hypothetical protein
MAMTEEKRQRLIREFFNEDPMQDAETFGKSWKLLMLKYRTRESLEAIKARRSNHNFL